MSGETPITIIGNLTSDADLKFVASGVAVASFTVASTPRAFDKASNEFKDQPTLFVRCSIWREAAENVAESLTQGMRVIVTGRLVQRSWETDAGEKRSVTEIQADEVGPSLKYATAAVTKAQRGNGAQPAQSGSGRRTTPPEGDPWATNNNTKGWANDEPNF